MDRRFCSWDTGPHSSIGLPSRPEYGQVALPTGTMMGLAGFESSSATQTVGEPSAMVRTMPSPSAGVLPGSVRSLPFQRSFAYLGMHVAWELNVHHTPIPERFAISHFRSFYI